MSVTITFNELRKIGEENRKAIRFFNLPKRTMPRRSEKKLALLQMRINGAIKNMPALCEDNVYRFPDYIQKMKDSNNG